VEIRRLGTSDLHVSVIGLGTWAMGNDFFGFGEDDQAIAAIRSALDNGVTLIDTAPAYGAGHAEEIVGEAIHGRRDSVVVATKVGIHRTGQAFVRNLKPEAVVQEIEDSLTRLQTDVIDLYQIHWPDPNTPLDDTLNALEKVHTAGKFRYLGVSNFDIELIEQVRRRIPVVSVQPHFSFLERKSADGIIPYCMEHSIGVIGYGSLAGGLLTGKFREIPEFIEGDRRHRFYRYFEPETWDRVQKVLDVMRSIAADRGVPVAHVAIQWSVRQNGITSALVGARTPEQSAANAAAGEWRLEKRESGLLEEAYNVHIIRKEKTDL